MASGRDDRPYFFLSYARTPKRDPADRDDPDRWVYKLYKDLCAEILQMTDARPEEAGFMDRENQIGALWSPELTSALARCRVFVPLYSRRYFESDNCGREWFAFAPPGDHAQGPRAPGGGRHRPGPVDEAATGQAALRWRRMRVLLFVCVCVCVCVCV